VAVELWRQSYKMLNPRFVNTNDSVQKFNEDSLSKLYSLNAEWPSDVCPLIVLRYYLEDGCPKVALANDEDTTTYLISVKNGEGFHENQFVPNQYLSQMFTDWNRLVKNSNTFVYVKEYRYSWDTVFKTILMDSSNVSNSLAIEHVAHTVSPNSLNYELPEGDLEGFIAFDLILWKSQGMILDDLKNYDFAVPCPKNCRNSSK